MNRMKLLTVLCFSAALAAQSNAAPPATPPAGIPAGAVKADDSYRYTDTQGRKWIYRQTPFGISRIADTDSAPAAKAAGAAAKPDASTLKSTAPAPAVQDNIRATDHGDTVSFERPGPFGVYRWERKKSDLDASERAAWQRQAAAAGDRK